MSESFQYDVFLSHSSKDKEAVRDLADRLAADGVRVWFDEWEILPGDPILHKIEDGLEQSRTLVLVMSRNAFASEWVTLERHTAMFRDPTNQQRRFIPVLLEDTEIKNTLRQYAYVDWREKATAQYDRLLAACLHSTHPQPIAAAGRKAPSQRDAIFSGHGDGIFGIAVTPDGQLVISASDDRTIKVWEIASGKCLATLEGHTWPVYGIAITPDGKRIISGSRDETLRVWELHSGACLATLKGHADIVNGVAVTPDGRHIISGSHDNTVRVWEMDSWDCIKTFRGHEDIVNGVAVTPNGRLVVSGSDDLTVRVWELESGKCLRKLTGHTSYARGVTVSPEGRSIVSGSWDRTIRVWDIESGQCRSTLEGHTDNVWGLAVTPDGRHIVSGSGDRMVQVWEMSSGKCVATLLGHKHNVRGVAVTPDGKWIISASRDKTVRRWAMPNFTRKSKLSVPATRYTNAKVLLVGDSGVGKSGLALRLTANRFAPTISTDGAVATRVTEEWATQIQLPHETNSQDMEREIWLWDFAGQADYRLIHQLFMDETALAVLVFNPQDENPFEGIGQWDRDLEKAARRKFNKLRVAGRCDRGGLTVSRQKIENFCHERDFADYLETSAQTGMGCDDLRAAIIRNITWGEIPWTASPHIFKVLKEEIVNLKDEGKALLRMSELRQQLEMRLLKQALQDGQATLAATQLTSFTPEQLQAVIGLLAGPGIIWQLGFGDFLLLQPERINAYAAAVIRTLRAHPDEIGCIAETRVLAGDLDYQDMKRLSGYEEEIVLRAMCQIIIDYGLCLRENTEAGALLVFPSYFRRERPEMDIHPLPLVTYKFQGMLDEIYATLVVRLLHTTIVEKDQLWRFAADFRTLAGQRVGVMMTRKPEGAAELTVYCEPDVPVETKTAFIRYVHDHLQAHDTAVVRERHYVCAHCDSAIEDRQAVQKRLSRGLEDILCLNCENRVPLWDLIEEKFASEIMQQQVREMNEKARRAMHNESRELILIGHAFAMAGEAGQHFRHLATSAFGFDGEIEFKNNQDEASGKRLYLQLKWDDWYQVRQQDGKEVFCPKNTQFAEFWEKQQAPVMLVHRTPDGVIRWMNVTASLNKCGKDTRQIVFDGEPFTAQALWRMRDRLLSI
ncbi:MAG TPA: TIR domain-containing protein [Blastocatellia bacterium]|nr:TIR domain-containing protein [Blastocatellia bacterium]